MRHLNNWCRGAALCKRDCEAGYASSGNGGLSETCKVHRVTVCTGAATGAITSCIGVPKMWRTVHDVRASMLSLVFAAAIWWAAFWLHPSIAARTRHVGGYCLLARRNQSPAHLRINSPQAPCGVACMPTAACRHLCTAFRRRRGDCPLTRGGDRSTIRGLSVAFANLAVISARFAQVSNTWPLPRAR
jgi:hypothetical protein